MAMKFDLSPLNETFFKQGPYVDLEFNTIWPVYFVTFSEIIRHSRIDFENKILNNHIDVIEDYSIEFLEGQQSVLQQYITEVDGEYIANLTNLVTFLL